ncbi:hypothetical protein [Azospira sp. I09]|uniref:hypothetical protein n=1 Tax=Azospira sp. I09 TaxID=1765049 RepID=UPI0012605937|nr:hypothetical protein [Azospira sp. I09]BBN89447.1 hypothetical protein AZSP09_24700 [Azospira sp. I09]
MGLRQMTMDEMRREHGLPEDAEYLGYAVHLEKRDEFLAEFVDNEIVTSKVWAKMPELAHTFESISEAIEVSRKCPGSIVVVNWLIIEGALRYAKPTTVSVPAAEMGTLISTLNARNNSCAVVAQATST